jgi:hypothetical protein
MNPPPPVTLSMSTMYGEPIVLTPAAAVEP